MLGRHLLDACLSITVSSCIKLDVLYGATVPSTKTWYLNFAISWYVTCFTCWPYFFGSWPFLLWRFHVNLKKGWFKMMTSVKVTKSCWWHTLRQHLLGGSLTFHTKSIYLDLNLDLENIQFLTFLPRELSLLMFVRYIGHLCVLFRLVYFFI